MKQLYPDDLLPWNLEPEYSRHVAAMTAENLHSKSEIAMQLAWRDRLIAELEAALEPKPRHSKGCLCPRC